MFIQEIKNKEIWEGFLKNIQKKTFLQSWNWGEFQKEMGEKIWRLGIYEKASNLVSVALVIKVLARRGNFLLVPHGPIVRMQRLDNKKRNDFKFGILKILAEKLKKIAKEEKVSFIRINPIWKKTEENIKTFKDLKFKDAPIHIHPEATWQLNINPLEEELLRNMRKTTRYLIKKAMRDKDIEIIQSQKLENVKNFSKLHKKVSQRQHFIPFSQSYLEKEFSVFQRDNQISLIIGKYKGKVIASAFVVFWSGKAFYHHAVFLKEYSKIPIAYFILWEAIKEAKKRRFSCFDFWGYVSPKKNPEHPWAGPTLFKMGFGGEKKEYVKTQDFPLSLGYFKSWIVEKIRKKKRSL